jgi:7-cyano-7-deazaguanine synthase
MTSKQAALVVLSGGQDSTTCLFWAREHFEQVHAVSFDYGQRHALELVSARHVATLAGCASYECVRVEGVLRSASPLTDPAVELETYTDYESMSRTIGERVELTFVPMRNAFFLTLAANRAVARGIFDLVTGVCQQDGANYPDCRRAFIDAQERTINEALGIERFKVHTPLMDLSKADSVRLAHTLPGCMNALAWSHTCYAGKSPPCGRCHACVLRARGFAEACAADPLVERTREQPLQVSAR